MKNAVQVFNFEQKQTRIVMVDGEPWWVAKDVAEALGYSDSSLETIGKLFAHIPEEWADRKRITVRSENGVEQERDVLCISEQGLYFFLGRSDKPKALPYQKWIAGDVVPSIRKHGAYMTPQKVEEVLSNPDLIIGLAQKLKDEQSRNTELAQENAALEARIAQDRPKVLFAESVKASEGCITIGTLAKILRQMGIDMGRNRLYAFLRKNGYLMRRKGADWNKPTQKSIERGLFEMLGETVNRAGELLSKATSRVTGKGQVFFVTLFQHGDDPNDMQLELFPVMA